MIKKGTKISTINGYKLIEEITKNDLILSYDIKTGKLCYNKPLYISQLFLDDNASIINNSLYLSKYSFIIDHDLNEEILVDASQVLKHPKLNHLKIVNPQLNYFESSVSYTRIKDTFYSLVLENTDFYFANNVMLSNGSSMLFIKDHNQFMLEDIKYRRVENLKQYNDVINVFNIFKLDDKIINSTSLKYASQSLYHAKQQSMNYYSTYLEKIRFGLSITFIGDRIL